MRRAAALLVCAVVCAAVAAPVPKPAERKLGPEWVKEKDGDDYIRKVEIQAVAQARSTYLSYSLPLVDLRRDLWITEHFGFMGKSVEMKLPGVADPPGPRKHEKPRSGHPDNMALLVSRTEGKDGKPVSHTVRLGSFDYFDLDGDGQFDVVAHEQENETRWYIYMEDRRVQVEDMSRRLNTVPPTSRIYETMTEFTFENGKWRVKK